MSFVYVPIYSAKARTTIENCPYGKSPFLFDSTYRKDKVMKKYFPPKRDFSSLSITDLLEARETYHVHLAHLENVVATAIGRYRIRNEDPDAQADKAHNPREWRARSNTPPRTLSNTRVESWSWPCLLIFVDKWVTSDDLVNRQDPDQVVPRFLYLPNGKVVPTCVILAEKYEPAPSPLQNLSFPDQLIGGGYPIYTDNQEQEHVGSLGCLVTDGDSVYALTNRHVTGEENRPVYSFLRGRKIRIGTSAKSRIEQRSHIGKKLFNEIYQGWHGSRSYANIDAGLIRIEDINYWTAQVFGIGEIDDPVDLNINTISLDLIGCPVRAFGGASGELIGEIQALFYRYKSIGGFEYISDFLIGPRPGQTEMKTRPGDSGTVWFFDPLKGDNKNAVKRPNGRAERLRPIALQWGGHSLIDESGEGKLQFALATCLSTICRELDVDIIVDWNIGHSEYWGKTGHYKIAAKACELIDNDSAGIKKLGTLLKKNVKVIGYTDEAIKAGELKRMQDLEFIPLADVPDLVWRATRKLDSANHFADMDEPGAGQFANTTLLELCKNPANVDITIWNNFYESLGIKPKDRGALPFRVWQLYNAMVDAVKKKEIAKYICAAGILAHYVGDACQPLHVSHLHHGRPGHPEEERVHSVYETQMLDRFATEVMGGVNSNLKNRKSKAEITTGHEAAVAVIELMRKTFDNLPPIEIIKAYNERSGSARLPHMWGVLSEQTTASMANGCLCLAMLWASAWKAGKGDSKFKEADLVEVDRSKLIELYNDKTFLPAYRLNDPEFAQMMI